MTVLGVVAALVLCANPAAVRAGGGAQLASRAPAAGEFPDNPLVGFMPADAPYAFASFKPVALDLLRKLTAVGKPVWRRALLAYLSQIPGATDRHRVVQDILDTLDTLDVKTIEANGFSTRARVAIYGIGAYPVIRAELANGDRVLEFVRRMTERWNLPLPPPTERAGRRYWRVDLPQTLGLFFAIAPKEVVLAFAPRQVIDDNLALLLGEQRPARSMTPAQFRTLAARDGFTGYGLGFVDLLRVGALISESAGASPDCRASVAAIAQRTPRLAVGYGDLTLHQLSFGMVLELAPEILADARGLSGSLAGLDRALGTRPAVAMAVAGNLEHGRTALGRAVAALQDLGQRCQLPSLIGELTDVAKAAARPLPPVAAGLRGGWLVVNNIKMGPRGPEAIDGSGSVQLDHAGELLKLAGGDLPNFDVKLDGKAHPLPPEIPFPGHVAATEHALGVALGSGSAAGATAALQGKAGPAPLALFLFDYSRLGDLLVESERGSDAEDLRDVIKAFGTATLQLLVDARGVVAWMAFEVR